MTGERDHDMPLRPEQIESFGSLGVCGEAPERGRHLVAGLGVETELGEGRAQAGSRELLEGPETADRARRRRRVEQALEPGLERQRRGAPIDTSRSRAGTRSTSAHDVEDGYRPLPARLHGLG